MFDGNASNQIEEKGLDYVPEVISGRTMLPVCAVCDALNADVQWNGNDNSITIKATKIISQTVEKDRKHLGFFDNLSIIQETMLSSQQSALSVLRQNRVRIKSKDSD